MMRPPAPHIVRQIVAAAIAEDLAGGDVTTDALGYGGRRAKAIIVAGTDGVLCGVTLAAAVFEEIDPSIVAISPSSDGNRITSDEFVLELDGPAESILSGERTALNFLQHLSGVATLTARYVEAVEGTGTVIADTRKTLPGMRMLQKYAVAAGGGRNHRISAADGMLIKDNHIRAAGNESLGDIIARVRAGARHIHRIEVEVENLTELEEALRAGADVIMLDNMSIENMRRAVEMAAGAAILEASGGIDLGNVRAVAETGVDIISVGALTHSAPAMDMTLIVL